MHDPLTVAHEIWRPWPQRTSFSATGSRNDGVRWRIRYYHTHVQPSCEQEGCTRDGHAPWPWWKPSSYMRFWRLAGRDYYWPALVTIWHREPHGHDSGEVCPHYRRWREWDEAQTSWQWRSKPIRRWRWHVHHWRIQIPPLQELRRRLLTRCAWCGGPSRKGDLVNFSHQWDKPRERWWRGETGLFHHDCSSAERAHSLCMCQLPMIDPRLRYGTCAACGKFRPYGYQLNKPDRLLAALPKGARIPPDLQQRLDALWAARRAAKAQSPEEADA